MSKKPAKAARTETPVPEQREVQPPRPHPDGRDQVMADPETSSKTAASRLEEERTSVESTPGTAADGRFGWFRRIPLSRPPLRR